MELKQNLSENLKLLRKEKDATLECFSADIGISRSNLQEIEQGKANATLDTVDTIARNLGISPFELLVRRLDIPQQIKYILGTLEQFSRLSAEKQELAVYHFSALVNLVCGGEP